MSQYVEDPDYKGTFYEIVPNEHKDQKNVKTKTINSHRVLSKKRYHFNPSSYFFSHPKVRPHSKKVAALLIGIEYVTYERRGRADRLPGCWNDTYAIKKLLQDKFNVQEKDFTILTDEKPFGPQPDRKTIIRHLQNFARNSHKYDTLILHYSGHGTQTRDHNKDEKDEKDEAIVPADYQHQGLITDDILKSEMLDRIQVGKEVITIFDSCNSGSVLDLPYSIDLRYSHPIVTSNNKNIQVNVFCLSGCRDEQTSNSALNLENKNKWRGAMTVMFERVLRSRSTRVKWYNLLHEVNQLIKREGFSQRPIFSFNRVGSEYYPVFSPTFQRQRFLHDYVKKSRELETSQEEKQNFNLKKAIEAFALKTRNGIQFVPDLQKK